jgi:hypothetical protein
MIRIGFGTNNKLHSRLIRRVIDFRWSHTWIEYPSELWGGAWAAHAGPHGVVKVPLEKLHGVYPKHISFDCHVDVRGGFSWAHGAVGAPYDYGVLWNGLLYATHRATKWNWLRKVAMRNTARFTCSEFVTGFLKAADVRSVAGLDPELTPPDVLYRIVEQSGEFLLSA